MSGWMVVMRFVVAPEDAPGFRAEATLVARLLQDKPGCVEVVVGRASDDPTLWLLHSRWESVGAYRRALSSYEVKMQAVPFLSRAVDEPTAYQVLLAVDAAGERTAAGDLAGDAGSVDRAR